MVFGWLLEGLVWARNVHPVGELWFRWFGKVRSVVGRGVGWFVFGGENCGCGAVAGMWIVWEGWVAKNLVVIQFLFDLERFVCMSNIICMADIICWWNCCIMKVGGLLREREKSKQARWRSLLSSTSTLLVRFFPCCLDWADRLESDVLSVLYCPYVLRRIVTWNICLLTCALIFDLLLSMNASSPMHFVVLALCGGMCNSWNIGLEVVYAHSDGSCEDHYFLVMVELVCVLL